jgi:ABC-type dipeptide/oligopeptide/nickel transport system permease component
MMFYGAGDPIKRMFLDQEQGSLVLEENVLAALREKYGLDDPFPQQFTNYIKRLAQGDMGRSIREKRPVSRMVAVRLPISIQLGLAATALMMLMGIPLGALAALKHNSWVDQSIVGAIVFLNAVPIFVTAPLLLWFLVIGLGVMDVPFGWKGIFHSQVILPVFILSVGAMPTVVRQTRSALLEVIGEDYIRTARAKGLPAKMIILRHMLRPVLIPVITSVGLIMIGLVNGAIFVELIFNIPGFGQITVNALHTVDYPVIMATVFMGALIVMIGNLVVDFIYPLLDPRITRG